MSIKGTKRLKIGDYSVEVVRKDIKNIHLSVHPPHGRLRVAVPAATRESAIRMMIARKLPWIKRQIAEFKEQERQSTPELVSGETIYLRGNRYRLDVAYRREESKVSLIGKRRISLILRNKTTANRKQEVMRKWLRDDLSERIEPLLAKWEKQLGVRTNDWSIRQMRTKWGSCNPRSRRVLFNLELAKKSDKCVEYVVLHELIHLIERRHNDRFIALLDHHMPRWRSYRAELNKALGAYEVD